MGLFAQDGTTLIRKGGQETVRIEPWERHSLRVRGTVRQAIRDDVPGALLDQPRSGADVEISGQLARISSGNLAAEISATGRLRFVRADGAELLSEITRHFTGPPARSYATVGGGTHNVELLFNARDSERSYGLGQHQHGRLNQKGAVVALVQRNTADEAAGLLRAYGEVTGRAPMLSDWAAGFWQCKLRYRTQDELLSVAREYRRRGLPLSVIVIDYFHWTRKGESRSDPDEWPDPAGMVAELDRLGVALMVSIWPTVNWTSENYAEMEEAGLLVGAEHGMRAEGETEIVSLCRSAWAGSQRYGALVWSGDIGGFKNGEIASPPFRELIVRWLQFGVFCPVFRLHEISEPGSMIGAEQTGAANEVWSFGSEVYEVLRRWLGLREYLRPYVMDTMRVAHTEGLPPMRPLFLNFPGDQACWDVADQFLLGDDLLVAPVVTEGAAEREVYLPDGAAWRDAWTGELLPGGQRITAPAPLEIIPVYIRDGGRLEPFGGLERFGGAG